MAPVPVGVLVLGEKPPVTLSCTMAHRLLEFWEAHHLPPPGERPRLTPELRAALCEALRDRGRVSAARWERECAAVWEVIER